MNPKELLDAVFELAPTADPAAALALGDEHWPEIAARDFNAEDAETCRLLSISAAELSDYAVAAQWRRRALIRAAFLGWGEMVAALVMADAFIALSKRNDDYKRGRTLDLIEGEAESVQIIKDLEPFTLEPGSGISVTPKSPNPALLRRFVLEKSGSFQAALRAWDDAIDSFTRAVDGAEGPRGRLKARGGLALAKYGKTFDAGTTADPAVIAETKAVQTEAEAIGEGDIAKTAAHNADVMSRGGGELLLYEIL